jgi:hypothetical protein
MSRSSKWADANIALQQHKTLQQRLRDAEKRVAFFNALEASSPIQVAVYKPSKGQAIPVGQLSDVHFEERVDSDDIPGVNNLYNPTVARKRCEQFFQRFVVMTENSRYLTTITSAVIHLGGDLITGYIHDELKESNFLSPTEASLEMEDVVCGGLTYVLDKLKLDELVVVCSIGNHGRTTEKRRIKTAAENSYEWLMYKHIAKMMASEKRIKFHIPSGLHQYLQLHTTLCRFHHGDSTAYHGGVGGISIALNKSVNEWNKIRHADIDYIGHYHQCKDFGNIVVNGSVMGYNAFALSIKAPVEPPRQSYTLIDAKRGKSMFAHLWTDYMPKEAPTC